MTKSDALKAAGERAAADDFKDAGWRESRYEHGAYYRVDGRGKAVRTNGRVETVARAEALRLAGLS